MSERVKWISGMGVLLCLALVGGGIGVFYRADAIEQREQIAQARQELALAKETLTAAEAENDDWAKKYAKLERELQDLKSELDGKDDEMRAQRERMGNDMNEKLAEERKRSRAFQEQAEAQDNGRRGRGGRGFFDLERLKTEDPERYNQMMARRREREQQMRQNMERRDQMIKNLDTSRMTASQRTAVERYQELTAQMAQMRENMANMTDEERRAQFEANRENFREMMTLQQQVRDAVFEQAVNSGDVEAAKSTMQLFGGPGGGFGGPGGGFGGRPGGPAPGGF